MVLNSLGGLFLNGRLTISLENLFTGNVIGGAV